MNLKKAVVVSYDTVSEMLGGTEENYETPHSEEILRELKSTSDPPDRDRRREYGSHVATVHCTAFLLCNSIHF
jgi:hypothetical protein